MKRVIVVLLFSINILVVFGQVINEDDLKVVKNFIGYIQRHDMDALCSAIEFPFQREYPIPEIKNKGQFLKKYKELFDDSLTSMIVNSDPAKDWSPMGWRGIMLGNGQLWLDYDGRLLGINYQSAFERRERAELIETERKTLHQSVREFKEPVCILETVKYRIRVDDLGNWNFRYVSWPLKSKMSDQPALIIEHGKLKFEGSGGNHNYEFRSAGYTYVCSIIEMGEDHSPPASLMISNGKKEILFQKGVIVGN